MELTKKQTSLEKPDQTVKDVLDWKSKSLQDNKLPVESGLADYISFAVSNIDEEIQQLSNYKDMITNQIKAIKEHKNLVQEECAEWFRDNGIDKLKGISCSSITINKGKEETSKLTSEIKHFIKDDEYEIELTFDMAIDLLVGKGIAYPKIIDGIVPVPKTKDKIKINAKRK